MKLMNKKRIEVPFDEENLNIKQGVLMSIEGADGSGLLYN
jgi:ABC-type lipoprotein export system ATPase subunit